MIHTCTDLEKAHHTLYLFLFSLLLAFFHFRRLHVENKEVLNIGRNRDMIWSQVSEVASPDANGVEQTTWVHIDETT